MNLTKARTFEVGLQFLHIQFSFKKKNKKIPTQDHGFWGAHSELPNYPCYVELLQSKKWEEHANSLTVSYRSKSDRNHNGIYHPLKAKINSNTFESFHEFLKYRSWIIFQIVKYIRLISNENVDEKLSKFQFSKLRGVKRSSCRLFWWWIKEI